MTSIPRWASPGTGDACRLIASAISRIMRDETITDADGYSRLPAIPEAAFRQLQRVFDHLLISDPGSGST